MVKKPASRLGYVRWLAWLVSGLFYLYQFVLRVAPSVLTGTLSQTFNLSNHELGHLSSTYYQAYALMQIPIGILLDRMGARRLISLSAIVAAAGAFLFGYSGTLAGLYVGRFMMGMGAACGFIGAMKISSALFTSREIARVVGLTMVMGTLGATLGGIPLSYMSDFFGWEKTLQYLAGVGLLLAIIIYGILGLTDRRIRELEASETDEAQGTTPPQSSLMEDLLQTVKFKQLWLIGMFGSLLYVPLAVVADLWGVPFLEASYGVSKARASSITTTLYYGVAFGSPLVAYLSSRTKSRRIPMFVAAIASFALYTLLISNDHFTIWQLYVLFFVCGLAFCGQAMVFSIVSESAPPHLTGLSLGFMNSIIMSSGVIYEPLVGHIIDITRDTQQAATAAYTFANFQTAFLTIPISMIIALIILFKIRETYGKTPQIK